jgi:tetratricopeptide (TPR) repeat protein
MEKFLDWLFDEDLLVTSPTLLLGLAAIGAAAVAADGLVKDLITAGTKRRLAIYLGAQVIWVGYWVYKKQTLPRTKKDKIGVVISLTTESNKDKIRLKNDFVKSLKLLVAESELDELIDVVLLKNYQAHRISAHLAQYNSQLNRFRKDGTPIDLEIQKARNKLQNHIRGVFYVYGSVVERDVDTYILETDMIIHHGPVDPEAQEQIAYAVNNIWSLRFSFKEKAEYAGFRFSAAYIYLSARYIIGEAAFVLHRYEIALKMHETLETELKKLIGHPNLSRINQHLGELLAEEHSIVAMIIAVRDRNYPQALVHVEETLKRRPNDYSALMTRSIIEYAHLGNAGKALQTCYQAKPYAQGNKTWIYNAAFLLMQMGQYGKAIKLYKQMDKPFQGEDETLQQVLEFNENILKEDPTNIESHYILGLLKLKKTRNYPVALDHFQRIIALVPDAKYKSLVDESTDYIAELEALMNLD